MITLWRAFWVGFLILTRVTFRKIFSILSEKDKKRAIALTVLIFLMSVVDVLGVASIMPFIAVLSNQDLVYKNEILFTIFQYFNFVNAHDFLLALGAVFFIFLLATFLLKTITTFFQNKFSMMLEFSISRRFFRKFLYQEYSWFLENHSSNLSKTILSEISIIIKDAVTASIIMIAQIFLISMIFILLVVVDPTLASVVSMVLGGSYVLIYLFTSSKLKKIGTQRVQSNKERFYFINEAFGAIKQIKTKNLEEVYIKKFSEPSKIYSNSLAMVATISQLPKFAIEVIAFGGLLLAAIILMANTNNFSDIIPIIALYALSGYKLMPAVQNLYASISSVKFSMPAIDSLLNHNRTLKIFKPVKFKESINFDSKLELNNISYNYNTSSNTIIKNLSLKVFSNQTIAFIGRTGSGKTTLVDIILGLLKPNTGTFKVDNQLISNSNITSWQKLIGYVSQDTFLADGSIASNIAFGEPEELIDTEQLVNVAKIANIHDFISKELPNGYNTSVGERGAKLSGGQKQRIGIARALYFNPKLLVLDEATSALDNATEKSVMEAIYNLNKNLTIIIIAHRLSTVERCDNIFLLEQGQIIDQGKFDDLLSRNKNLID